MINSISTIITLINSLYIIYDNINDRYLTEIKELIEKRDMKNTIKTINDMINNVPENDNSTLKIIINSIKDIIKQIEKEIIYVQNKIDYNKRTPNYLFYMRYNFKNSYNRLCKNIDVLENRYEKLCIILIFIK